MENLTPNRRFGIAWVTFALAVAVHVTDEAMHDFLSTYNPSVRAIRARLSFLPLPMFSFRIWLALLTAGIFFLLCAFVWDGSLVSKSCTCFARRVICGTT